MKWQNDSTTPAGPIQCKRFNKAWNDLTWENNTRVEKLGVIGVDESSFASTAICGGIVREDVQKVKDTIGARYNWTVSKENVNQIIADIAAAMPALVANRPCDDKRRTPEQDAAQKAEAAQNQAKLAQRETERRETFARHYAEDGEPVAVDNGACAVVAVLTFDNSHLQSDYFDKHATLGFPLLLAVFPHGPETEARARAGLARCPMLAGEFEWHTEKYSGGHGNYLRAKSSVELPAEIGAFRTAYEGNEIKRGVWEIQFWHGYPAGPLLRARGVASVPFAAPAEVSGASGVVRYNRQHDGIEVDFPAKPDGDTILTLKAYRFRWSPRSKVWYRKACADALDVACRVTGTGAEDKARIAAEVRGDNASAEDSACGDRAYEDQCAAACGV